MIETIRDHFPVIMQTGSTHFLDCAVCSFSRHEMIEGQVTKQKIQAVEKGWEAAWEAAHQILK